MNEIEAAYTRRFESIYTAGEVELNNRLYEECLKDPLDCAKIEELLRQGANPLGAMAVSGWDLLAHVYGEVVYELYDSFGKNLPRITELFLKHGMDIDFRNWNDFYYEFDTSHCTREPEFYQSVVRIFEAESKKEIWKIGICLKEGEI